MKEHTKKLHTRI